MGAEGTTVMLRIDDYRRIEDLARLIAALMESNEEDTLLAVAVGAEPTTVDLEVAEHIYRSDWLQDYVAHRIEAGFSIPAKSNG